MNLSAPFIKRPIATTLLAIGIALAGILSFNLLPVAPLPQVEFPTISVQASLPGASAETMATSVATPLERQIGRIAGVNEMTSTSSLGTARITVQFDLSRQIDAAARDIQAAINAARSQLPANLPSNPTYRKTNPADAPIMIVALTSDTYSPGQMYDIASTLLQQKISQVNGVGQVDVGGSSLPAVRVELNPTSLHHYGISLNEVRNAIAANNINRPKGAFTNDVLTSEIISNDQIFQAYQYRPLIIAVRNGRSVRLSHVGEVSDSIENVRTAGFADGKLSVFLIVFKQPGANVIQVIDRIRAMLPQLTADIPAKINLTVIMDRGTTIRASLHDVEFTLLIALILVILVVYAFLTNLRAMIIPGVAVLLSLLGTFSIILLLGFSLNNLSLMALTIATGFVIDDAVVVLENIMRYLEMGYQPLAAALKGSQEVSFTVLSMSLSLIAIFIPILLMGGIVGRLFREFSVTLSVAIMMSLLVSLTVTPMMCAQLLKLPLYQPTKSSRYAKFTERIRTNYQRSLKWALSHSRFILLLILGTILLNILLYVVIPKGFFPQQDTGHISASIQGDQDISFQAMRNKLLSYVNIVHQDPGVAHLAGFLGGSTTNTGNMFITLKPQNERKISADAIINRIRNQIGHLPGASLVMQPAQDLVIGGRAGRAQFQYTLSADNLTDLNTWAPQIQEKLAKLPGIADVNSNQLNHGLQVMVTIDRDKAAQLGISVQEIDRTLYSAFGQSFASTLYKGKNQYHVVLEAGQPHLNHLPDKGFANIVI